MTGPTANGPTANGPTANGRRATRGTGRYLLPYERPEIEVRRHWMILMMPVLKSAAIVTVGLFFLSRNPYSTVLRNIVTLIILGVAGYLGYQILQWRKDRFIVTDRRVLLVSGILTRRTAIMPLSKVTDMTYEQTPLARMLQYGTFVFESAGQDQALSRVTHLPGGPRQLYLQISGLLFANDPGTAKPNQSGAPEHPPDPERPRDREQPGDPEQATVDVRTGRRPGGPAPAYRTAPIGSSEQPDLFPPTGRHNA